MADVPEESEGMADETDAEKIRQEYRTRRRARRRQTEERTGCSKMMLDGFLGTPLFLVMVVSLDSSLDFQNIWTWLVVLFLCALIGFPISAGVGILLRLGWRIMRDHLRNL